MNILWLFFYDILVIPVFWIFVQVAALFNAKVRRGVEGRRDLFARLESEGAKLK
jgi:hypothetical protein